MLLIILCVVAVPSLIMALFGYIAYKTDKSHLMFYALGFLVIYFWAIILYSLQCPEQLRQIIGG
jgi:hypothetical protein